MRSLSLFTRKITKQPEDMSIYMIITIIIFAPLTWVRTVETFQYGYIFGVVVIFIMVIVVSVLIFIDLG